MLSRSLIWGRTTSCSAEGPDRRRRWRDGDLPGRRRVVEEAAAAERDGVGVGVEVRAVVGVGEQGYWAVVAVSSPPMWCRADSYRSCRRLDLSLVPFVGAI